MRLPESARAVAQGSGEVVGWMLSLLHNLNIYSDFFQIPLLT